MARQERRWVAAGIYQPTYEPRHAYGPHRGYSPRAFVGDEQRYCGAIHARQIARYANGAAMPAYLAHLAGVPVVSVPMPRGGYRLVLVCPHCQRRATCLYGRYHSGFRRIVHACRKCWGLRYQSQYAGRRIEAHPDYLRTVMQQQIARTPRNVSGNPFTPVRRRAAMHTHWRRMRRYEWAGALYHSRKMRHLQRSKLATDLAIMVLLARSEAKERRHWRKILNQVLWHRNTDTMRELLTMKDTPEWAQTVLTDALALNQAEIDGESTVKQRQSARKALKSKIETASNGQFAAIIEQVRLDTLRGCYAALGQGSRRKRAA